MCLYLGVSLSAHHDTIITESEVDVRGSLSSLAVSKTCHFCNKTFSNRQNYLRHMRSSHNEGAADAQRSMILCQHEDCRNSSFSFHNLDSYRLRLDEVHHVQEVLQSCQLNFETLNGKLTFLTLGSNKYLNSLIKMISMHVLMLICIIEDFRRTDKSI